MCISSRYNIVKVICKQIYTSSLLFSLLLAQQLKYCAVFCILHYYLLPNFWYDMSHFPTIPGCYLLLVGCSVLSAFPQLRALHSHFPIPPESEASGGNRNSAFLTPRDLGTSSLVGAAGQSSYVCRASSYKLPATLALKQTLRTNMLCTINHNFQTFA